MSTNRMAIEGLPAAAAYLAARDAHIAAVSVRALVVEIGLSISADFARAAKSPALLVSWSPDAVALGCEYASAVRVEAEAYTARMEALAELYTLQQAAWQHGIAA
jgi:hypothetical protein